jgi:penicillin-binding protein 1A
MLLGGLKEGVTPLEMAYAYSTIANDGKRISGKLAPDETGPVAIQSVEEADGTVRENKPVSEQVLPPKVAQVEKDMLRLVVSAGTGKAAQVGDESIWGKTGTTENYGDAWFVGGNDDLTVAIWVGYADKLQPMEYEHAGGPVAGGTFPAEIFHDFMTSWLELRQQRRLERAANKDHGTTDTVAPAVPVAPTGVPPATQTAPTEPDTGGQPKQGGGGGGGDKAQPAPQNPAPAPEPAPTPAPAPTEPPSGGGGGGGATPGGTD